MLWPTVVAALIYLANSDTLACADCSRRIGLHGVSSLLSTMPTGNFDRTPTIALPRTTFEPGGARSTPLPRLDLAQAISND